MMISFHKFVCKRLARLTWIFEDCNTILGGDGVVSIVITQKFEEDELILTNMFQFGWFNHHHPCFQFLSDFLFLDSYLQSLVW